MTKEIINKHSYLNSEWIVQRNWVTYWKWPLNIGWRNKEEEVENPEEENIIYDRRKVNINNSIQSSQIVERQNLKTKLNIINLYDISEDIKEVVISNWLAIICISFYKQWSDTFFETFENAIKGIVWKDNFTHLRNINLNYWAIYSLSKEWLHEFLNVFNQITQLNSWDELVDLPIILRLVKSFKLQKIDQKYWFTINSSWYYLIPIKKEIFHGLDISYVNKVAIIIWVKWEVSEQIWAYVNLRVEWEVKVVINFINLLDIFEYVFSELRSHIYSESDSWFAEYRKTLTIPNITLSQPTLPIVYLLDSWLPPNTNILNPMIQPFIVDQLIPEELEWQFSGETHAVKMAWVIIYWDQLLNVNFDNIYESEIVWYARLLSILIWDSEPKLNLHTIPELLYQIKEIADQNIKIVNASFNLKWLNYFEWVDINHMSFLIDLFLFFNPDVLFINSVWNYLRPSSDLISLKNEFVDNDYLNIYSFKETSLQSPSDWLNVFSIWSLENCSTTSWGESTLASHTRKSLIDNWIISNNFSDKSIISSWREVKKISIWIIKPDLLSPWCNWNTTIQDSTLKLLCEQGRGGTSYASAYISHLSAKTIWIYPELQYASSIEALFLHFSVNFNKHYHFSDGLSVSNNIYERINLLKDKFDSSKHPDIYLREEKEIIKWLVWGWVVNPYSIISNLKNVRTIIIESSISLCTEQIHNLDLRTYIPEAHLIDDITKVKWTICFKALPDIDWGLWYNLINIQGGFSFTGAIEKPTPENKSPQSRSWRDYCRNWMRSNRQKIPHKIISWSRTWIQKVNFLSMVENNYILKVHAKSIFWRKKETLIKDIINDYIEFCSANNFKCSDLFWNINNISDIRIPYSIVITLETHKDIDLYWNSEAEVILENEGDTNGNTIIWKQHSLFS
jgi:hypothetical protein